jgi:hypothetical protein
VAGAEAQKEPTWPCPACGHENDIHVDLCVVCGTSFAALMRQDEVPPTVDPKEAVRSSLVFPGLGHRKAGRALDGFARGALFALMLTMALFIVVSGLSSPVAVAIFLFYVLAAITVYVGSAYEAAQIAEGGQPFIGARKLLWITVGLILGSVVLLASSVVFVARR